MSAKTAKLRTTFAANYTDVLGSESFNAMRPLAQLLLLKSKQFYNRTTEGPIHMSVRTAAGLTGIKNKKSAASLIAEVVHHGFWRKIAPGYLGSAGHGMAAKYRFTDERFESKPATLDFKRWDGSCYFVGKPRKTKTRTPEKDRPVLPGSTARTSEKYRVDSENRGIGTSEFCDPVPRGSTHLEICPSFKAEAEAAREQGCWGQDEPTIGHNAGPALDDQDLRGMPKDLSGHYKSTGTDN
jgi:hypothetical protein